ncbi:hypothetical protein HYH02_004651 [Chlamydomonas schloesseri]|uniref:CBM20 domain-containing protein n=1 Tax=Chlamydomonas schloesseri TaxID=2026947 RepID=A0A836B8E1_9CHLO|nr:hypothetical protein HYH02_004651 [Chlamydomonas schloesseri]|eukprot:KAG2450816.1 hypothetical protein HYH02_004651 [Chlamydomonas schloesseri]
MKLQQPLPAAARAGTSGAGGAATRGAGLVVSASAAALPPLPLLAAGRRRGAPQPCSSSSSSSSSSSGGGAGRRRPLQTPLTPQPTLLQPPAMPARQSVVVRFREDDKDAATRTGRPVPTAAPTTGTSQQQYVPVVLQYSKRCAYGQGYAVVGSVPELGAWDVARAVRMKWSEGDKWEAVVRLPVDVDVQYKYVLVRMNDGGLVCWEGAEQAGAAGASTAPMNNLCLRVKRGQGLLPGGLGVELQHSLPLEKCKVDGSLLGAATTTSAATPAATGTTANTGSPVGSGAVGDYATTTSGGGSGTSSTGTSGRRGGGGVVSGVVDMARGTLAAIESRIPGIGGGGSAGGASPEGSRTATPTPTTATTSGGSDEVSVPVGATGTTFTVPPATFPTTTAPIGGTGFDTTAATTSGTTTSGTTSGTTSPLLHPPLGDPFTTTADIGSPTAAASTMGHSTLYHPSTDTTTTFPTHTTTGPDSTTGTIPTTGSLYGTAPLNPATATGIPSPPIDAAGPTAAALPATFPAPVGTTLTPGGLGAADRVAAGGGGGGGGHTIGEVAAAANAPAHVHDLHAAPAAATDYSLQQPGSSRSPGGHPSSTITSTDLAASIIAAGPAAGAVSAAAMGLPADQAGNIPTIAPVAPPHSHSHSRSHSPQKQQGGSSSSRRHPDAAAAGDVGVGARSLAADAPPPPVTMAGAPAHVDDIAPTPYDLYSGSSTTTTGSGSGSSGITGSSATTTPAAADGTTTSGTAEQNVSGGGGGTNGTGPDGSSGGIGGIGGSIMGFGARLFRRDPPSS